MKTVIDRTNGKEYLIDLEHATRSRSIYMWIPKPMYACKEHLNPPCIFTYRFYGQVQRKVHILRRRANREDSFASSTHR